MGTELISVIMGIYNCEDTLQSSIESVLHQTYTNWELILCDDCSIDGTFNIAGQYAEQYQNITVLKNSRNMSLSYSLNHCLKVAKGEYIARMDADDISLPDRFEKQLHFLQEHPQYDVVGSGIIPYDKNGNKTIRMINEFPDKWDLIHGTTFFHPTIMMKKRVYEALNGYFVSERTKKGQDIDLWFRFFAAGYHGYNLQEPLLKYHESIDDYKNKRSVHFAWGITKTKWLGFHLNHFPAYVYPYAFKPLISALVPKDIMYSLHNDNGGK